MKCGLDEGVNNCPFFISRSKECTKETVCSFQDKDTDKYVRKERWYEKYQKRR